LISSSKMLGWKLKPRISFDSTTGYTTTKRSLISAPEPSLICSNEDPTSLAALSFELQIKEKVNREEALRRVESLWEDGDPDEILSKIDRIELSRHDFETLKDEQWLNDSIIDAYMALIMKRSQEDPHLTKVYAFSTYFYTALESQGYQKVTRWTSKIDVFSYNLLLLPIHSNDHWTLIVFDRKLNNYAYLDSLATSDYDLTNSVATYHIHNFASYLVEESMNKRKIPYDRDSAKIAGCTNIPTQDNETDCGAFICAYAENFARGELKQFLFDQSDLKYLRFKMCYELGIGRLF